MKVLWLINVALPEASRLMGEPPTPFGGWLVGSSKVLAERHNVRLAIAYPGRSCGTWLGIDTTFHQFRGLTARPMPEGWFPQDFASMLNSLKPDLVHIFGTEFAHTLAMVNACIDGRVPFVISVQGLASVIAKHYTQGLPPGVQRRYTPRDLVRRDNVRRQQEKFMMRGRLEVMALQKARHIIGRTCWDQACVWRVNPTAIYHHCNEILRPEFYEGRWASSSCETQTLFMSQGSYPIKGLHFLLEAFSDTAAEFPESKLLVAGTSVVPYGARGYLLQSSYSSYIAELLRRYGLRERVRFTGALSAREMKRALLSANVFVLPSTIENSPNSLGEAMLLGMPVVASYVGGVPDFVDHGVDGYLYQSDAPYMLAHHVRRIFTAPEEAENLGRRARLRASKLFDPERNTDELLRVYADVVSD